MNEGGLSTRDILLEFGFQPDESVISDVQPGLALRLGDFKLSASWVVNDHYVDIVLLSGVYNTSREIGMVDIQLPRQMESREQCAAWLVWGLNNSSKHLIAESSVQYEWFELGKANKDKLPWVIDQAAYNARPQCAVERRWLRLALNTLAEALQDGENEACVTISFQNNVLLFQRCQPWRAKRRLVDPSSREAALLTRRAHSARGEAK